MDLKRLAAFVKVVDIGSVTRAASLMKVAQPGLSQQILSLEHELRVKLLDRSPRGVTPTEEGRILYRHARMILRQFEDAQLNVSDAHENLHGHVRVGLTAWSTASMLGDRLISAVLEEHPGILVQICDTFPVPLSEMVLKGGLDMAYLYGGLKVRGLTVEPCGQERFVLALPEALVSAGPTALELLAEVPLILPPVTSFQRQMVDRVLAGLGRRARVRAEVYTLETAGRLMQQGVGGMVVPAAVAEELGTRLPLHLLPLPSDMALPLALCTPEADPMSNAAHAVHSILRRLIST